MDTQDIDPTAEVWTASFESSVVLGYD